MINLGVQINGITGIANAIEKSTVHAILNQKGSGFINTLKQICS